MFERTSVVGGLLMLIPMLIAGVIPLAVTIWVLIQLNRAVRALESIADTLRRIHPM